MKIKLTDNQTKVLQFSFAIFLLLVYLVLMLASQYSYLPDYDKDEISYHLNRTGEKICLASDNDTEKTQMIIDWENGLFLKPFYFTKSSILRDYLLRFSYRDPQWFVYIRKANCEERALIFEDMANRTNLTYRKVGIAGFIDPVNDRTENHRWTEVWINNSWQIADSGFNLWYPKNNQSYFTVEKDYLIGKVVVFDDNGSFNDCTDLYVNRTGLLKIKALREGNPIENATVSIKLNYENLTCNVVGGNRLKLNTDNSGDCEVVLGVYENTSYTVIVEEKKQFYKYTGTENVIIKDGENYLAINIEDLKLNL
jgi:hypothetical protein